MTVYPKLHLQCPINAALTGKVRISTHARAIRTPPSPAGVAISPQRVLPRRRVGGIGDRSGRNCPVLPSSSVSLGEVPRMRFSFSLFASLFSFLGEAEKHNSGRVCSTRYASTLCAKGTH